MWYIHAVEIYSAIKTNQELTHSETWMNVDIVLHKRSRTQEATHGLISFIQNIQKREIQKDRKETVIAGTLEERGIGSHYLIGMGLLFEGITKFITQQW